MHGRRYLVSDLQIILSNKAKCHTCETEIESTHIHDFKYCQCGSETPTCIAVDGGRYYLKRLYGKDANWEDTSDLIDLSHLRSAFDDITAHGYDKKNHIECQLGWLQLVVDCHNELKRLDPNYTVLQIKQKFGGLRYYFDTKLGGEVQELMSEVVRRYEAKAEKTCELTGLDGELIRSGGWYAVRNPKYAPADATPVNSRTDDARQ